MCALKSSGALLQDCFFIRPGLPAVSFVSACQRSLAKPRFRSLTLQN